MSIYFPEADVAIEVIPEPDGLPEADCGASTVRIYVREDQVDNDALVEALADLIHGREGKLGRNESGVGSDDAMSRAQDFLSGEPTDAPGGTRRDAQELMEDLLDAQEELADALSDLAGQMLISPTPDLDDRLGQEGQEDAGYGLGGADDLDEYDLWLQDRLDELCCAQLSRMRRPGREINIGSCKNLYIGV